MKKQIQVGIEKRKERESEAIMLKVVVYLYTKLKCEINKYKRV